MDLKLIIEKINQKNDYANFDMTQTPQLMTFLSTLKSLQYLGHGGMCLCLSRNGTEVVKCCKKKSNSIVYSREIFTSWIERLKLHKLTILYPLEILYEDDYWFVYTQPMCQMIDQSNLSIGVCIQMLDLIEQMIIVNLKMTDIFYRNFGIYQNKVYLFDFHEIELFDTPSSFMLNNLYSTFIILGKNIGWHQSSKFAPHTHFPTDDNFGDYKFPREVIKFLRAFRLNDHPKMLHYLGSIRNLLMSNLYHKYTNPNHQYLTVTQTGQILISSQVSQKYQITADLINKYQILKILDLSPGIGDIGLKLAHNFPQLTIDLIQTHEHEQQMTQNIANQCVLTNIHTKTPISLHKYDLILSYSNLHQQLKSQTITEILTNLKRHQSLYFLLEVPIIGDIALNKVMETSPYNTNFKCLTSTDTFRYQLMINQFQVIKCIRLNPERKGFIRFVYVLKI